MTSFTNMYNIEEVQLPIYSKINIEFLEFFLCDYIDKNVVSFLKYGFPIGAVNVTNVYTELVERNHKGAVEFPTDIDAYLQKEIQNGSVIGPFHANPFSHEIVISPLNSVPKKDTTERRIILDISSEGGGGVNTFIDKDMYLGEEVSLKYPNINDLVSLIKKKGRNCHIFKRDLSRAYR